MAMTPLSTLPTGQRFSSHGTTYLRCQPTAWDALRDSKDHDLNGVDPQIQPRTDAIYAMQVSPSPGVLVLFPVDALVEVVPEPTPAREYAYRVTLVEPGDLGRVYGVKKLNDVRRLVSMFGRTTDGGSVAIEHNGVHIGADGVPTREQGRGLQFRNVEARVVVGSINL